MRLSLSLAAALGVLTVVSAAGFRAGTQSPSLEGYPAVGTPATVTLLSPGGEPRRALRYRIAAGHTDTLTMAMAMTMAMTMGEFAAPATPTPIMKMTATIAVTGIADNGDITYDLAFTGVTPEAGPGVDASLVEMLRESLADLTRVKGTITVSNRGINRAAQMNADQIADPNLRQMFSSMSSSIESMSTPWPEEAVGVGARWEVRQAMTSGGVVAFQKSQYELVSMDGDSVGLRVTLEQTAPSQRIEDPSLPPGAKMDVERMSGSGSGTMTLRLDRLVPAGELSNASKALMTVTMDGQTQRMTIDSTIRITMGSK